MSSQVKRSHANIESAEHWKLSLVELVDCPMLRFSVQHIPLVFLAYSQAYTPHYFVLLQLLEFPILQAHPFIQADMSWWWSQDGRSLKTQDANQNAPPGDDNNIRPTSAPIVKSSGNSAPNIETPARTLSRDEQAYEELKDLFRGIDTQRANQAATHAKEYVERPKEDYSNSLYASTMSCSACFDQAYYCSSVGGQLNNVYRYGALRSCSDLWAQWRFCMRTKVMSEDTKHSKIREFNQRRAAKYKMGPSSEDVWELRKEPVENPFPLAAEQ